MSALLKDIWTIGEIIGQPMLDFYAICHRSLGPTVGLKRFVVGEVATVELK